MNITVTILYYTIECIDTAVAVNEIANLPIESVSNANNILITIAKTWSYLVVVTRNTPCLQYDQQNNGKSRQVDKLSQSLEQVVLVAARPKHYDPATRGLIVPSGIIHCWVLDTPTNLSLNSVACICTTQSFIWPIVRHYSQDAFIEPLRYAHGGGNGVLCFFMTHTFNSIHFSVVFALEKFALWSTVFVCDVLESFFFKFWPMTISNVFTMSLRTFQIFDLITINRSGSNIFESKYSGYR